MFLILPYHVDVPYDRKPFANWLILGLIAAIFFQQIAVLFKYGASIAFQQQQTEQDQQGSGDSGQPKGAEAKPQIKNPLDAWILHGWNPQGIIGHMWLHGGFLHLLGNMWFLWLFGNAVCAKVGNKWFGLMYLGFGFAAAATHLLFSGEPALGASGAINGVVGMFLVFFPENDTSAVLSLFFFYWRRFSISSYWLILLWFAFDIWGAMRGAGGTAYFAHLGGFAAGFVLATFLLERKWVTMEEYETSLLQLVGLQKKKGLDEKLSDYGRGWEPWQQEIADQQTAQGTGQRMQTLRIPLEPPPLLSCDSKTRGQVTAQPTAEVQPEFVRVLCSCGKKVKFPVQYAGRTGRCPACNKPITIPDSASSAAASSAKSGSAANGMICFSCKCGKKIKVPSRYSGRAAKCPQCHAKLIIP